MARTQPIRTHAQWQYEQEEQEKRHTSIKVIPHVAIDLDQEIALLKKLHDVCDDTLSELYPWDKYNDVAISDADLASPEGQAILEELNVDDLLTANPETLANIDQFYNLPTDPSPLSGELTLVYKDLLYIKEHEKKLSYKSEDLFVYVDGEKSYNTKPLLDQLDWGIVRQVDYVEKFRNHYDRKKQKKFQEAKKFVKRLFLFHSKDCTELQQRLVFATPDGRPSPAHAWIALSYLFPLQKVILQDPQKFFSALRTVDDAVLFDAILMLGSLEVKEPDEVVALCPLISRYILATQNKGFYEHHGVYVNSGCETARKSFFGEDTFVNYAENALEDENNLLTLFKQYPQVLTEVVENQDTGEDVENTLTTLCYIRMYVPQSQLTEEMIRRAGRIFSGLSEGEFYVILDSRTPQQFVLPLILGHNPEFYEDAPALYPREPAAKLFADENTAKLLCTLMSGYYDSAGSLGRSEFNSGFMNNEVLNEVVLPSLMTMIKAGFTLDEINDMANHYKSSLTLSMLGLEPLGLTTKEELLEYFHWAMPLLQEAGDQYPQTAARMGVVAGMILLWADPLARQEITELYGEQTSLAALGLALALLPPNRLDVNQRLLPSPLPAITQTAKKSTAFAVQYLQTHKQARVEKEVIDGFEYKRGGEALSTEHNIIALNLMYLCVSDKTHSNLVAALTAMGDAMDALIKLFCVVENQGTVIYDQPSIKVWQANYDKLSFYLTYLSSFSPVNSAELEALYAFAESTFYPYVPGHRNDWGEPEQRKEPALMPLLDVIKENGGVDFRQVTSDNLSQIVRFTEFMDGTGKQASWNRGTYENILDLTPLILECQAKDDLHFTISQATQLDHINKTLGPKLVKGVYLKPPFDPNEGILVDQSSLNATHDRLYVITALGLPLPPVSFGTFEISDITTIRDLLYWFDVTAKLRALPGGADLQQDLLTKVLGRVAWERIQEDKDLDGLNVFDLQSIEDLRRQVNARTDNVTGDGLVVSIALGFVNRSQTKDSLPDLLRFARAWSQTALLKTDYLKDVKGRYLMGSMWAATKARDWIEANYRELYGSLEVQTWERDLAYLGYPVRQSIVGPVIGELEQQRMARLPVVQPKRLEMRTEVLETLNLDDRIFIEAITKLNPSEVTLNNTLFADIRLDDITTTEFLRIRINTLSGTHLGDDVIMSLYSSELNKSLDSSRLDIEYAIFKTLRAVKRQDPFGNTYRDLADFLGGRLVTYLKYDEAVARQHPRYQEFVQGLAACGFTIPSEVDDSAKAMYHLGRGHFDYISSKIKAKGQQAARRVTGASDIDSHYQTDILTRDTVDGALPGFSIERIHINGRHVATMVKGQFGEGGRVSARVKVGGGVRESTVSAEFGDTIVFQAPVTMVSGANKGVDLMTSQGRILNPSFDPQGKDGYIIVTPSGRLRIANKWDLRLSDLTGRASDSSVQLRPMENAADFSRMMAAIRANGLTILTSLLFEDNGLAGRFTEAASGDDSRRYILQFADGSFGMIDSEVKMSINEMLTLSYRLGAVKAVYCDTGMFDRAAYYTYPQGNKTETRIGWQDAENSSNRIIFYSKPSTQ